MPAWPLAPPRREGRARPYLGARGRVRAERPSGDPRLLVPLGAAALTAQRRTVRTDLWSRGSLPQPAPGVSPRVRSCPAARGRAPLTPPTPTFTDLAVGSQSWAEGGTQCLAGMGGESQSPMRAQEGRALRQPGTGGRRPCDGPALEPHSSVVPRWPQGSADAGGRAREGFRTPFPRAESCPLSLGTVCPLSWCRSMPLRGQRQLGWRSETPLPWSGPWCWALLNLGMGLASPSLPR